MDGDEVDLVSHTADFVCNLDPEGINVVQSRDFKGDETIISVRLKSGTVLPCRVNHSADFNPGSKVTLTRSGNEPLFALKKSNSRQSNCRGYLVTCLNQVVSLFTLLLTIANPRHLNELFNLFQLYHLTKVVFLPISRQ